MRDDDSTLQAHRHHAAPPVGVAETEGLVHRFLGRRVIEIDADALIASVIRRTRLADFGDPPVAAPLRVLVESLNREARLSITGAIATRLHLREILETRLHLAEDERQTPALADAPIRAPVFVTGVPRSGTTLLHNLLAQDPANRAPTHWETMFPWPAPGFDAETDRQRIASARRRLWWADRMAPKLKQIHPLGALLPQECVAITAYSLYSTQFHEMYRVPTYQRWLQSQDATIGYRFHRRFLQHLGRHAAPRRWVLKAPSHLGALDALFAVYPDAYVVQTHRDPVRMLASVASLGAALQRLFNRRADPEEIGASVVAHIGADIDYAIDFRERDDAINARFIDVHYAELLATPMAVIKRIYDRIGAQLTAVTVRRIERLLADNPQHKHGRHDYDGKAFGLDDHALRARFDAYCTRFAIAREGAA